MNSSLRTLDIIRIHERNCSARGSQRVSARPLKPETERNTRRRGERMVVEATGGWRGGRGGEEGWGGRGYRWWEVNLEGRTRAWKVDPADAPTLRYDSQSKQVPFSSPEGRCRIQHRDYCRNGYAAFLCLLVRASGKMDFLGRARARSFFREERFSPGRCPPQICRLRRTCDAPLFPCLSGL